MYSAYETKLSHNIYSSQTLVVLLEGFRKIPIERLKILQKGFTWRYALDVFYLIYTGYNIEDKQRNVWYLGLITTLIVKKKVV